MNHRIVLYSSSDPRKKANAALLMALYVVRSPIVPLPQLKQRLTPVCRR